MWHITHILLQTVKVSCPIHMPISVRKYNKHQRRLWPETDGNQRFPKQHGLPLRPMKIRFGIVRWVACEVGGFTARQLWASIHTHQNEVHSCSAHSCLTGGSFNTDLWTALNTCSVRRWATPWAHDRLTSWQCQQHGSLPTRWNAYAEGDPMQPMQWNAIGSEQYSQWSDFQWTQQEVMCCCIYLQYAYW